MVFLNVHVAKIREKSITAKRKTIFFIGKSPLMKRKKKDKWEASGR